MKLFIRKYLGDCFDVLANDDVGQQRIYCLIRKGGPVTNAQVHLASDQFLRVGVGFVLFCFGGKMLLFGRTVLLLDKCLSVFLIALELARMARRRARRL